MIKPVVLYEHVLIDFHGVLTDGRQSISYDGQFMFDHIHTRDVRALRELVARGFQVTVLTASSNPVINFFVNKVGVELLIARDKEEVLPLFGENFAAIGDDVWDLKMLQKARRAFCPSDAHPNIKEIEGIETLYAPGGGGCIAEILPKLLC